METIIYFLREPTSKIIIIILICGLIGGIGNTLKGTACNWVILTKNIFLGIIASIAVPLFLNLVSSDIIKNIYTNEKQHILNYLIFSGFCIIASFSSLNFLNTISGRVLQNLKNEIKEVKSDNASLAETTKRLDKNITTIATTGNDSRVYVDTGDIEKFKNSSYLEIMNSIKNEENKFRPLDVIKTEVNLDNTEIERKIEILKDNKLVKEIVLGEGEKAVALTEEAEHILK